MKKAAMLLTAATVPALLWADFSYTDTTRITGGAMMQISRSLGGLSKSMRKIGEPMTSTILVKGNRMARVGADSTEIWDLDAETITNVDHEKKTYSVITFAQMKEAMEKAMRDAQGRKREAEAPPAKTDTEVNYKFDVKETGKTQTIEGMQAREVIMTMTFEAKDKKSGASGAMDTMMAMWMTDKIPGREEYEAFNMRLAQKLAGVYGSAMQQGFGAMMADPKMRESIEKMSKEAGKMSGTPLKQITKMGTNLDPATASQVTDPATMPQGPTAGQVAQDQAGKSAERAVADRIGRSLPGGLGGLGGFGRRKKQAEPPPQEPQAQQQPPQASQAAGGVLMEMVSESTGFSTAAIDGARFAAPAGYQKVDHPMLRR